MATQVTSQDRLLLLDGHSLAYRAFFALPIENFSTTTGQPTNAVYGFTAMLINVLRDEKPTHLAVAFDRGEPTFRHEQYVEYKANRRETPEDFRSQLSLIFEVLDALGIRRLSAPGYEADDLIATLATQAAAEDMDVLIVTGDRDVLQLVSDRVTALMTRRGITEMTRFTPADRDREVRAHPGAVPRLRRPARRPERQPARHPRGGGEDRDQVDRRVRLAAGPGRPGGRGQGQGRRRAARAPGQRAAQPPAHRAGHRPARRDRRRGARRPAAGGLGPGEDPPALRHAPVQGAPRAPLPDPPARPHRRDRVRPGRPAGRRGRGPAGKGRLRGGGRPARTGPGRRLAGRP